MKYSRSPKCIIYARPKVLLSIMAVVMIYEGET